MSVIDLLANLPPWPEADFSAFGEVNAQPLSKIQQLTGAFLSRNWVAIPHVTHHDLADVTEMELRRQAYNVANPNGKLTPPALIAKAVVAALKSLPQFNASLDKAGTTLFYKKYYHIGFAIDTPKGLLVAVVRDCDKKSAAEIAGLLTNLAAKARTKGLSMPEMSGGSMTISSIGHIGGTAFTPIINAPEVAILGMTRIQEQATRTTDGGITWRQMLPLSLSYDHRVINGADAARFTRFVSDQLAGESIFI